MNKKNFVFALSTLVLVACGGNEENTETVENTEDVVVEEVCSYSYNPDETVFTWTAFKLTDKVGVNGTFNEINVVANNGAADKFEVLSGASFSIPVGSLDSQDEVRDPKIKNSFFGVMTETTEITGKVTSIDANGGKVEITMNGVTHAYEGEVKVDEDEITFLTTIDILDFEAQASIDSLGVVCEEKHTGPDGVNKLWSDVEIAVKTTLDKSCE